jgi:hypothetical protein
MIGGIYFAGAYFAGVMRVGPTAASLAASAVISFTGTATISNPPARLEAAASIVFTAARADLSVPIDTTVGISIGGIPVTGRVRVNGLTIHDILNDAPNTATFTIEGEAPAVGQRVRITSGPRLLFTGAVQTIDQAFESKPEHLAWHLTAIDDTAEANARRPFGTWVETSATTIAQSMTTTFAPGFSTAGIAAGLEPVTIVFDGADPFIACLARLATAIGGYCKIEDRVVYLFTEDLTDPPHPLDDAHPFLMSPPITMNTDSSQLRTRVYGKGYGETIPTDVNANETLLPIQDGVMFPPLGGTAIVGLTADGAQSDKIAFTGVVLKSGGSLVGTGSSPTNPPVVALAGGAGVTSGDHTLSVAYRTAAGQSLAGPPAAITAGTHAPPATAPTAATAINGTGPDQGSHDYTVAFVTSYGETIPSPISNAVTTSAAAGQVTAPGSAAVWTNNGTIWPLLDGALSRTEHYSYAITFVTAAGETEGGNPSGYVPPPPAPTSPGNAGAGARTEPGGGLTSGGQYAYYISSVTAGGYETELFNDGYGAVLGAGQNAIEISIRVNADQRVTKRRLYRTKWTGSAKFPAAGGGYLVAEITDNTSTIYIDKVADSALSDSTLYYVQGYGTPVGPRGTPPGHQMYLEYIPAGAAGVTARKIYRAKGTVGAYHFLATLNNNTTTSYVDNTANNDAAADMPTSNTTGTAVQRIPVSNIPIGPASVTARKLYRRFNGAGTFKLVTTLANNSTTTFNDAVANAALGAAALGTATAVGNQIAVTLPIGASAVTTRELYMSPVGGSRRLIQTIADNTTTAVTVTIADAAITGALEPTADTSGLQQPSGQVNPGSTVLPVAASAPYRAAGGWVTLGGGQVVRHTGISGNTLTGIPATGSGAITTTVLFGQQAIPAPMLIGVTGLARPMLKGSAVHIWIQRDDLLAQTEHAARTGGDGIVEFLIVDNRRGVDSLAARCEADLALFSRPIVTVSYATRDLKTKSGKPIVINLPSQGIATTLTIQDVTITEIDIVPGLAPRYTVKASSVRFSLEDTLRRLIAVGPVSVNA